MKEEWLLRGAIVPIDAETTAALIYECKRLIDVVGSVALAQREWVSLTDEELLKTYGWQFESYGQSDRPSSLGQSIVDEAKQEIIDGLRKVEAKLKEKNDRN